jgi:hypothetical protein
MKTITSIFARPITETHWFFEHEIEIGRTFYQDYINENFKDTGDLIQTRSFSDDNLVMTVVNQFTDKGFDAWFNDDTVSEARLSMLDYNNEHNIVMVSLNGVD